MNRRTCPCCKKEFVVLVKEYDSIHCEQCNKFKDMKHDKIHRKHCIEFGIKKTSCSLCQDRFTVLPGDPQYENYTDGMSFVCNKCIDTSKCAECEVAVEEMMICDGPGCNSFFCYPCAGIEKAPPLDEEWLCEFCKQVIKKHKKEKKRGQELIISDKIYSVRETLFRTMRQNVTSYQGIENCQIYLELLRKCMKEEEIIKEQGKRIKKMTRKRTKTEREKKRMH